MNADDPRHGRNRGYIAGCREACCRAAHARHHKNQRTRKYLARVDRLQTEGTGTRRRIQALMALGWSSRELDKHLDRKPSYTYRVLTGKGDVYLTTALMFADLYDQLKDAPPEATDEPGGAIIRRNKTLARRNGYALPHQWLDIDTDDRPDVGYRPSRASDEYDEVVVDRAMSGDFTVRASRAEKVAIVRAWLAAGRSANELELRSGWNVRRYRDEVAA